MTANSNPGTSVETAIEKPAGSPIEIMAGNACRSPLGTFAECPLCGGDLAPEHAHFRCGSCGWRDSCCD